MDQRLENVASCKYLSNIFNRDEYCSKEIRPRIANSRAAFGAEKEVVEILHMAYHSLWIGDEDASK